MPEPQLPEEEPLTPVVRAARLLTRHHPRADRRTCTCGQEWHPRHQAEALARAGLLKERSDA